MLKKKSTIITILLALVAMTGQAFQYRIVGNIGTNDFTGWLYLMNQSSKPYSDVDSLWVENGEVRDFEGYAQEPFLALLHSKGKPIVQFPCLFVEEGTVRFRPAAMTTIGAAYMGTPLNDDWARFYTQFNTIEVATDEGRINPNRGQTETRQSGNPFSQQASQ